MSTNFSIYFFFFHSIWRLLGSATLSEASEIFGCERFRIESHQKKKKRKKREYFNNFFCFMGVLGCLDVHVSCLEKLYHMNKNLHFFISMTARKQRFDDYKKFGAVIICLKHLNMKSWCFI